MKVPASIRGLYDDQKAVCERLGYMVDERIKGIKRERWHYESRIKELTSFALKVESGRFWEPHALEDFFACTIVVANSTQIAEAEAIIGQNFKVHSRRPKDSNRTHKEAHAFPFDDLRLYVSIPSSPTQPSSDVYGVIFEVQVKTFLQHAWSIATHDLLYKTDEASWSKARIAFQIRAMLEHAEVSIQEAATLAATGALNKEDDKTADLRKGIGILKSQWAANDLPRDLHKLASNIIELLRALKISLERLDTILSQGKSNRAGAHPANLSPYATVIQYLFQAERSKLVALLEDANQKKIRVLIPNEVELPSGLDTARFRNAIWPTPVATA